MANTGRVLEETRQGLKKIFGDIDITKLPLTTSRRAATTTRRPARMGDRVGPQAARRRGGPATPKSPQRISQNPCRRSTFSAAALLPLVTNTETERSRKCKKTDVGGARREATRQEEKDLVDDGLGTKRAEKEKILMEMNRGSFPIGTTLLERLDARARARGAAVRTEDYRRVN